MSAPGDAEELHRGLFAVWANPTGWRRFSAVNHSTVGAYFLVTGAAFFVFGGLLSLAMRAQLAAPGRVFMNAEVYAQAFTMHGTVMMFLFAVPMMEGFAVYLIPKMIGARDLVFPRLSAFGYWCYLFGGVILAASFLLGRAPDAGWFMYVPLSSRPFTPGVHSDVWLLGVTFVEISAVTAAVELIVAILRTRAPGMALSRMPIYAWYVLAMAVMIVLGFPPLILGSVLLELERAAGLPFFDVAHGGDPLLWQHLFWLFGHPEVYIIFLPAAGLVSALLPAFARRPLVAYRAVVLSVMATAFLSFGLWVHHMFTVGIPHLAQSFFSAASMLVAVPTGVQVFAWIATLWLGRPVRSLPMLWLLGFLMIFVAGGLTGVMLALVPFDWQVHDTHFVVAHLHYVLIGGMLFPLIAAIYYWLPHFSGHMPSPGLGRWAFWLVFIGFNLTFLVMHWTGMLGMPRRVFTYDAGLGWELPNLVSSLGAFVMAIGIGALLLDVLLHFRFGGHAGINPWRADSLEWAMRLPPAPYNFASLPRVDGHHPLWDDPSLPERIERGEASLASADHGRRETWGTDALSGEPREIVPLPGNTWLPLWLALTIAALCLALIFGAYAIALPLSLAVAAVALHWSWRNGARLGTGDIAPSGNFPLHWRSHDGPGRWGMLVTLLADGALYASLLFGWVYLWTVAPHWQVPPRSQPDLAWLANVLVMLAAAVLLQRALARLHRGAAAGLAKRLALVAALGAVQLAHLLWLAFGLDLAPRATAHDAVTAAIFGCLMFHGALATVVTALQARRAQLGIVGADAPYEPRVVAPLWWFNLGLLAAAWLALSGLPAAWKPA